MLPVIGGANSASSPLRSRDLLDRAHHDDTAKKNMFSHQFRNDHGELEAFQYPSHKLPVSKLDYWTINAGFMATHGQLRPTLAASSNGLRGFRPQAQGFDTEMWPWPQVSYTRVAKLPARLF
jgi:hypothetical protein